MSNGKKMNLPNRLTLARIALTPICVAVIMLRSVPFTDLIGAFLFLLIAITDMLDGKIARKYDLITNFGKFLDPLADKFLVVGTYLALIYRSEGYFTLALIIMTIVTIFREFAVSWVRLVVNSEAKIVIPANYLGKVKTVSQIVFVISFLVEPTLLRLPFIPDVLAEYPPITIASFVVCFVFTVISGLVYLRSYMPYVSSDK